MAYPERGCDTRSMNTNNERLRQSESTHQRKVSQHDSRLYTHTTTQPANRRKSGVETTNLSVMHSALGTCRTHGTFLRTRQPGDERRVMPSISHTHRCLRKKCRPPRKRRIASQKSSDSFCPCAPNSSSSLQLTDATVGAPNSATQWDLSEFLSPLNRSCCNRRVGLGAPSSRGQWIFML